MYDRRVRGAATLFKQLVHSTIIPVGLLVVWEVVSRYHMFSPQALPAPSQVFLKWIEYARPYEPYDAPRMNYIAWLFSGELPHDLWATFFRVLIGFLIGAGLALPLGLFMGNFERIYQLFNPLIQVLRPIPPIAYVPLSILWFGLGNPPAFFLYQPWCLLSGPNEYNIGSQERRCDLHSRCSQSRCKQDDIVRPGHCTFSYASYPYGYASGDRRRIHLRYRG